MWDTAGLSTVTLGLLMGARHALDADHVVAVTTVSSERRGFRSSCAIGAAWGLGHAVVLLVAGGVMVAFKATIPDAWANFFEACVGIMLVGLGLSLGLTLLRERLPIHPHAHSEEEGTPVSLHSHRETVEHSHGHTLPPELKSLCIGMVHGLAGSAMVPLLLVSTTHSALGGILYLSVFGLGSIAGMVAVAAALNVPFVYAQARSAAAQAGLQAVAGFTSMALGGGILMSLLS